MKKTNRSSSSPITESMLKPLVDLDKATAAKQMDRPAVGVKPVEPAALYQDSGNGYNNDYTIPQP